MYNLNEELYKFINKNEMTQSQIKNWMDWPDIISFRDTFISDINNDIRDKLLLALYTYIPPRRILDYFEMYVLDMSSNDNTVNFYDMENKKFIFNKYKTAKKYGRQEIPIPDELYSIINSYIRSYKIEKSYFQIYANHINLHMLCKQYLKMHSINIFL